MNNLYEALAKLKAFATLYRRALVEAALLTSLFAILFFWLVQIQGFEELYQITRRYEDIQLDNIVLALGPGCLVLAIFSYLRLRDARRAQMSLRAMMLDLESSSLRESDARFAAENANRAKSGFLANMSHELRTPLNAVIGYAEILEEDLKSKGNAAGAEDAVRIHRAARNLLGLINDVLDLSKIEAGKMDAVIAEVDIRTLAGEVVETVANAAAQRGNSINVSIDPNVHMARTDEVRLRQCLLNLLSNACKFTENGTVKLTIRGIADRDGDLISFSVQDTGIGMTAEEVSRLFQAFTQADATTTRKYGGTGLGLMITRNLARLLGGDVVASSVFGEGSTFTFTIRAALDGQSSAPKRGERIALAS